MNLNDKKAMSNVDFFSKIRIHQNSIVLYCSIDWAKTKDKSKLDKG